MKNIFYLLLLSVSINSCTTGAIGLTKNKRANKLIGKAVKLNPHLLENKEIRIDTVFVTKPVTTTDTFTLKKFDTIQNVVNNIKYKLIREVDTFQIEIECPPDTLEVSVIKEVPIVKYTPLNWWQRNSWWVIALSILLLIIHILRKIKGAV